MATDTDRVKAAMRFRRSRFGTGSSPCEIAQLTGLSLERVNAALTAMTAPPRDELAERREAKRAQHTEGTEQTLTCGQCGQEWTRVRKRGTVPRTCPSCKVEAILRAAP